MRTAGWLPIPIAVLFGCAAGGDAAGERAAGGSVQVADVALSGAPCAADD